MFFDKKNFYGQTDFVKKNSQYKGALKMKVIIAQVVFAVLAVIALLSGNSSGVILALTLAISLGIIKHYVKKNPSKTPDEYLQEARKRHGLVD